MYGKQDVHFVGYHVMSKQANYRLVILLGSHYQNFKIKAIIIIIRKGRQCNAGRERLTPYQFEDPNPTTPTHRMKEEKGKTVGDKKWASS